MKSMVKAIAALAGSVVIATASLTAVASASVQPLNSGDLERDPQKNIWTAVGGSIKTDKVHTYSESFNLDYGTITLGMGENGLHRSALTANSGYDGNYKYTYVSVNGNYGHSAVYTPERDRNKKTVTAVADDVGTVTDGKYFSFLFDGTGQNTDYLERSVIYVE